MSPAKTVTACSQPSPTNIAAAFDLVANGAGSATIPRLPTTDPVPTIPPSLLKAIGWIESGWRQFDARGRPLVAPDFGCGVMQVTSGMAGAYGDVRGDLDPAVQAAIASDYRYNIAYGAQILARKWAATPAIGNGDPAVLENWYYAIWAYNGWGWFNNPNNPNFTRTGTPATDPWTYPYQERVLYFVAHPPRDRAGNPLWRAIPVTLPAHSAIGSSPRSFTPSAQHRQPPALLSAVYRGEEKLVLPAGATAPVAVQVTNTGTVSWPASGIAGVSLTHHLLAGNANPFEPLSPFANGVLAFSQGATPLPHMVLPGRSVLVHAMLAVPTHTGRYRIAWDLQQGDATWFSQDSVPPLAVALLVQPAKAPTATPTATPTAHPPIKREDELYVRDTSVPDGTVLAPGTRFDKGWLVFNSGMAPWGPGWAIRHTAGSAFGFKLTPAPNAPVCRSANVVVRLRAPKRPGTYTGVWRLTDAAGSPVGDPLTVVVVVRPPPANHTPTPTALPRVTATPTGRPVATATPTPVG